MALLLEAVTIEPAGEELARAAGEALAAIAGATTIDALVMASAARRGGVVYTSDVTDLERLPGSLPVGAGARRVDALLPAISPFRRATSAARNYAR